MSENPSRWPRPATIERRGGLGVGADGSPVAVALALPTLPDFAPVIEALPSNARVLDLGCGVGRLANHLAGNCHHVVAVDSSPEMLVHVDETVRKVNSTIEDLALDERFDVVVLASNLINTGDDSTRNAFLATCTRHVAHNGHIFIEHFDPTPISTLDHHRAVCGEVVISLAVHSREGSRFVATIEYALQGQSWSLDFDACLVDDDMLAARLGRPIRRLNANWSAAGPS